MQKELLEHIKTEEPATKDIQQIRILQVEDDAVDCEIVERVLTKSQQPVDFSIESVESFEAAVERLSKNEYDLILLDLGLPDSKGTEIIQEVRRINATVPLVVLTGLDDEQTGLSAIQKGADDYLVKGSALNDSLVRAVLYAIERNKAERALQESELKFRTIFENAGGAIFIADIETGIILDCNSIAEKITGLHRDKIIGLHQSELHPAEDKDKYTKTFHDHAAGRFLSTEVELRHADGKNVPVWFSAQKVRIDGKELLIGLFIDITERRKAQLQLQAAEERYRTIFENSAVAIMMADQNERLVSWNKFTEGLLEMEPDDLFLRSVKSLYPASEWDKIRTHNIRQKGMQYHLETKMFKKNGDVIDVDLSLSVAKNASGETTGSIGVVRDITTRKKADRKMQEAMEMKSEFISTVSHELRTPLVSMKEGISSVLNKEAGSLNADQTNLLSIAERNVDRLTRLINDVLDFQKFESGKMGFNMEPNDINEVANEAYDMMSASINNRKLMLILDLEENLPKIKFDRDRIIQVLINLVNNAIKFTEKGKITVTTRRKENIILVSVTDTGHGITAEDLPRLFQKFEQLEKGGDRKTGGTGLGLAISKEIIEQHNAKIWAESTVGKGTSLHFVLPIMERRAKLRKNP